MVALYVILVLNLVIVTADLVFTIIKSNKKPEKEVPVPNINDVEYSDKIIGFIREYSVQVALLKYREFIDSHEINKITRTQLQNLVTTTAKFIDESLLKEHINFDRILYTKEFVDAYMIHTVIFTQKELFDKSVENYKEGE